MRILWTAVFLSLTFGCAPSQKEGATPDVLAPQRTSSPVRIRAFVDRLPDEGPLDLLLEGEDAQLYLEAFLDFARSQHPELGETPAPLDGKIDELFAHLVRVRLKGTKSALEIQALFKEAFSVQLKNPDEVKRFTLYGLDIPRFLRFKLSWKETKAILERVEDPNQTLALKVKIPVVSDRVYFHRVSFDPQTGDAEAQAGVMGDNIQIYAKAEVYDRKFTGVDYWKTFLRNYSPLFFPWWSVRWVLY